VRIPKESLAFVGIPTELFWQKRPDNCRRQTDYRRTYRHWNERQMPADRGI